MVDKLCKIIYRLKIIKNLKEEKNSQFSMGIILLVPTITLLSMIILRSNLLYESLFFLSFIPFIIYIIYIEKRNFRFFVKVKKCDYLISNFLIVPLLINCLIYGLLYLSNKFIYKYEYDNIPFSDYLITTLIFILLLLLIVFVFINLSYKVNINKEDTFNSFQKHINKIRTKLFITPNPLIFNIIIVPINILIYIGISFQILVIMYISIILLVIDSILFMPFNLNLELEIETGSTNYLDILQHKLYFVTRKINFESMNIIKIDFNKLCPNDKKIINIEILNQNYIDPYDECSNSNSSYIYLCIPTNLNNYSKFKVKISVVNSNDLSMCYDQIVIFAIEFKQQFIDSHIDNYKIIGNYIASSKYFHTPISSIKNNDFKYEYLMLNAFVFDKNQFNNAKVKVSESPNENRKLLLHNGKYGIGKSTLDIYLILQSGFIPVVISPWENNYDIDILKLIYDKINEKVKLGIFPITTNTFVFISIFFLGYITTLKYTLDLFKSNLTNIIYIIENTFSVSYLFSIILCFSVFFIVPLYIGLKYLPNIIVFKKDSTKIYQNYYIKRIIKAIEYNNLKIIIEDIDRLDFDKFIDVTRILSSLNSNNISSSKYLGIVSYCEEDMRDRRTNKNDGLILQDVRNKVLSKEIFNEYDTELQMRKYLKYGIEYLIYLKKLNYGEFKLILNKIDNSDFASNINFRDLHSTMGDIIRLKNISISSINYIINRVFI